MSGEDEFSISELRRKREQSQSLTVPPPPPGGHSGPSAHARPPEPEPRPTSSGSIPHIPTQPFLSASAPGRNVAPGAGENELPVDPWRLLGALQRRWYWLVLAAVVLGGAALAVGLDRARSEISIKLVRQTSGRFAEGVEGETFRLEHLNLNTLADLMNSLELAKRVGPKLDPPLSAETLLSSFTIIPHKDVDLITLKFRRRDVETLPGLANTFANEVVAFTRELQVGETRRLIEVHRKRIEQLDADLRVANDELVAFQGDQAVEDPALEAATYTKKIVEARVEVYNKQMEVAQIKAQIKFAQEEVPLQSPLLEQIAAARQKRDALLIIYTEQHHEVKKLASEIAALEAQAATLTNRTEAGQPAAGGAVDVQVRKLQEEQRRLESEIAELDRARAELQKRVTGMSDVELKYADLRGRVDSLRLTRQVLTKRMKEMEQYLSEAQGYFKVYEPVTREDVDTQVAKKKAVSLAVKAALFGFVGMAGFIVLGDLRHQTIKTVSEVERITRLRVLATLGNLDKLTPAEQEKWAFRAWTVLAGQLNTSANQGMVCGFMSSGHGEGRSTWINLLGNAASQRGLRVLTISTKPSGTGTPDSEAETARKEKSFGDAVEQAMKDSETGAGAGSADEAVPGMEVSGAAILSANAFAFPAEVTEKFKAGQVPAAHIPLPGWVWNLERRRQWQSALAHWRAIDNLVLLVELPPACVSESVLLAESLPQVVWLVDSGKAPIRETKEQLEMLRHAKCRIVGAVLNHEPDSILNL